MTTTSARFAVGIDLGTTNTALACTVADDERAAVEPWPIAQVTAAGEVAPRALLPSFLYLPSSAELPAGALDLPWASERTACVGELARKQAATVPGRVVSSAKSWLCHGGVDRRGALLPLGAPEDVHKLSPVEVSARLLGHVVDAWGAAHPDAPLAQQDVVLTVPASFDAVARALTEEAARSVGLGERLTLLEEPQAALYAWLSNGEGWRKQVKVGELILVVDIGGGTTDFSLIEVQDDGGTLALSRVAVGEHILLGGDNMDLALAWRVKQGLEQPVGGGEGKSIDDWQLRALTHSCRLAKEALLEDGALQSASVAIPGRGSKLVGGTVRAELSRAALDEVLLAGFFPEVDASARPTKRPRTALQTVGLPYAQDAAITRHLAAFLDGKRPQHVLFNGGVTKSAILRERVLRIAATWLGAPLHVLEGTDPDTAVAAGAAYYARARRGHGVRIKGGAPRAYYVGIERAELAVPGLAPRVDAVCIAPKGMEEGSEVELPLELGLVVGEPAAFRFFSSTTRQDAVAATIDPQQAALDELAPIEATIAAPSTSSGAASASVVPVKLRSRVTEVGTLELFAVEVSGGQRHKLEFDIRE